MEKYLNSLSKSILFENVNINEINTLLSSVLYNISNYEKNDVIAIEEDDCKSLGIILNGSVEIHKSFPSGKIVTITSNVTLDELWIAEDVDGNTYFIGENSFF